VRSKCEYQFFLRIIYISINFFLNFSIAFCFSFLSSFLHSNNKFRIDFHSFNAKNSLARLSILILFSAKIFRHSSSNSKKLWFNHFSEWVLISHVFLHFSLFFILLEIINSLLFVMNSFSIFRPNTFNWILFRYSDMLSFSNLSLNSFAIYSILPVIKIVIHKLLLPWFFPVILFSLLILLFHSMRIC